MGNASALNFLSRRLQGNAAGIVPSTPEAKLMAEVNQQRWLPLEQVPEITGLARLEAGALVERLRAERSVVLHKTVDGVYLLSV